jgi:hypothetical protein
MGLGVVIIANPNDKSHPEQLYCQAAAQINVRNRTD